MFKISVMSGTKDGERMSVKEIDRLQVVPFRTSSNVHYADDSIIARKVF